jgi:hypothetical protein
MGKTHPLEPFCPNGQQPRKRKGKYEDRRTKRKVEKSEVVSDCPPTIFLIKNAQFIVTVLVGAAPD